MRRLAAVLVLGWAAVACTRGDDPGQGSADGDTRMRVVASFYPLAEIVERIGGDRVVVDNLTPAGAEPHDLELTPEQVELLEDASVVVYVGGGFQPAIEEIAEERGQTVVDAAAVVGATDDPHFWLDPAQMAKVVDAVEEALVGQLASDTDNPFAPGAEAYRQDLAALDGDIEAALASCRQKTLVTAHDAFGHFGRRYGLDVLPIAGLSPEAEPDPRRLDEVAAEVEAKGVTTIFYETLVDPGVAETLAREVGVGTAVLDPIEGLSQERLDAGADYESVMRENLAAVSAALECG